jgi:hypothetical protein
MGFIVERKSSPGSDGLIGENLSARVSPTAMQTRGSATMGLEENLKARIYDLEYQLGQKEEDIIKVKVEMSEEIQRLKSELHAVEILLNAKEEQIRRSNRRTKLRVYLP